MTIGANIKKLKKELKLNTTNLAKLSNIPLRTLQDIENDLTDPRASNLKKIIIALGSTADMVLFDDEELGEDGDLQILFRELSKFKGNDRETAKQVIKALIIQQKSKELYS